MAFNVWFVIWPAQKVVIASANSVASGGAADPRAAAKAARALCASRTNALFSIPMLFFMGAASHLSFPVYTAETVMEGVSPSNVGLVFLVNGLLIGLLWLNALIGKPGPLATVKGVIHCGFLLAIALYLTTTGLI